MIYNFDGYKYIKFYEIIFQLLIVKKNILDQMNDIEVDIDKCAKDSNSEESIEKRAYYIIYQLLLKENVEQIKEDIKNMKFLNGIDILNYKLLYDIFIKHSILLCISGTFTIFSDKPLNNLLISSFTFE